jgi:hypothetical protein
VARLHTLCPQQVSSVVLFDKLAGQVLGRERQDQAAQIDTGFRFDYKIPALSSGSA